MAASPSRLLVAAVLACSVSACGGSSQAPSAPSTPPPTTQAPAPTGSILVTPIVATLVSPTSTTYTVTLSPSDPAARFAWSGPGCGTTKQTDSDDSSIFSWSHPEPPCPGGPAHAEVTIRLEVTSRGARVVCTYQGAQSGTGPACAGS